MATIKIKELPVKVYDEISNSDIMVIEDNSDTKQITVEDLQLFFSSDKKLLALKESIDQALSDLEDYIDSEIAGLSKDDASITAKISDLFNDHERTKARLGDLIEKVVDIENLLNNTVERVEKNETSISNLQKVANTLRSDVDKAIKNIETNTKDISAIKEKNTEQDLRFQVDEEIINEFKEEYKKKIAELENTVTEDKTTAKEYADQLYDQVMKYIDFYHHFHDDPPNFDDPNEADTKLMNLVYKVGSVYETNIPNFEPEGNLPGEWKYVGATNMYNTSGDVALQKYTYVRVI